MPSDNLVPGPRRSRSEKESKYDTLERARTGKLSP